MKKTMILAAFAALISLASCQKEEVIDNGIDKSASPVFTASIAGATKTTIDLTNGKVAWETTDEITVTDAAKNSATYTIESIDATTGNATFVIKSGETALGDGPYTATYGTAPATAQTYSATAGKLYMTAPETSTNSFTFTVQCGLMKLNLTKTGESVKSIAVTGTPTGGSETTYTLTCTEAQSIATAKDFCIALPAGSYTKIVITNAEDITCTLNSASGVAVAANHIKPVTFGEGKLNFAPAVPDGALAGVFSVSATKKVYFSKGNLYYDGSKFNFEANQYDTTPTSNGDWDASHVSHFYWSKDARVAYSKDYNNANTTYGITPDQNDVFFTNETETTAKAGFTVNVGGNEQSGWRTLSTKEWQYLFNTRTFNNGANTGERYSYQRATINSDATSVYGMILYPDNYTSQTDATSYKSTEWTTMEENGCVFLPAAGGRGGSTVNYVGSRGFYWSSTAFDRDSAYYVFFRSSGVGPDGGGGRLSGCSVRLVTESK